MEKILKLIPQDPQFVPDSTSQQNAKNILATLLPNAEEILVVVTEESEFVDPGEHLKEIHCPSCGTSLTEDWWLETMHNTSKNGFIDLGLVLPCCGNHSSLNDLKYKEDAGFARFILEALNPRSIINQEQIGSLEKILGCKLKMIIAQY